MVGATSRNQLLAFSGGKPVAAYKAHVAGTAISKVRPPPAPRPVCGTRRFAGRVCCAADPSLHKSQLNVAALCAALCASCRC